MDDALLLTSANFHLHSDTWRQQTCWSAENRTLWYTWGKLFILYHVKFRQTHFLRNVVHVSSGIADQGSTREFYLHETVPRVYEVYEPGISPEVFQVIYICLVYKYNLHHKLCYTLSSRPFSHHSILFCRQWGIKCMLPREI